MAERENIRDRIRRNNPQALAVIDAVEETYKKAGGRGVGVDLTEDMTPEEEEMALFEGFLKEGYDVEMANRKAKEWLAIFQSR
jgi:hypothetical protein